MAPSYGSPGAKPALGLCHHLPMANLMVTDLCYIGLALPHRHLLLNDTSPGGLLCKLVHFLFYASLYSSVLL